MVKGSTSKKLPSAPVALQIPVPSLVRDDYGRYDV